MPDSVDTYLTVNPDGTISFNFTGHISAQGIDFVAIQDVSTAGTQAIRWEDVLNGLVLSWLLGTRTTSSIPGFPNEFLWLEVDGPAPPGATFQRFCRLLLESGVNDGVHTDSLSQITATVQDPAQNGVTKTFIRSDGVSSFLQLLTDANLKMASGSSVVTWPGASNITNTTVINHGMQKIPSRIICTVTTAPGVGFVPVLNTFTRTNTQFSVNGDSRLQPGAGVQCAFDWLAIG